MILVAGIISWTILVIALTCFSWIRIGHHLKVYLLITYSAVLLIGIFCIFPFLKKLQ